MIAPRAERLAPGRAELAGAVVIAMRQVDDRAGSVEPRRPSAAPALRADEVSRHAVRMVVIDRACTDGRCDGFDGDGVAITAFADLPGKLRAGDLVVVNDAATLPGALRGGPRTARRSSCACRGPSTARR